MTKLIDTKPGARNRAKELRKLGFSYQYIADQLRKEFELQITHQSIKNALLEEERQNIILGNNITDERIKQINLDYSEILMIALRFIEGVRTPEQHRQELLEWKEKMRKDYPEVDIEAQWEKHRKRN